jgi:RHH-type transcriptional regulator, rel operon repressor / antitoxin RelB
MALLELPADIDGLLEDEVKRAGGDKLFHLREAVLEYASERSALRIAEQRYQDLLAGRSHTVPLEEVMREYGVEG